MPAQPAPFVPATKAGAEKSVSGVRCPMLRSESMLESIGLLLAVGGGIALFALLFTIA